jgi:anaerobic ribonucleoside-triphosphate reductase activating protein
MGGTRWLRLVTTGRFTLGEGMLRVAHRLHPCETLGPGRRAVIWVAGCSLDCPGCVARPILGPDAGRNMAIDALAEWVVSRPGCAGLTLSGGEPFEQAAALVELVERVRAIRDISVMAYSGFRLETLRAARDPARRALLEHLDILVDGRYVQALGADLLWRGSSNQRIHLLTPRHAELEERLQEPGAGVEVHVTVDGRVFWAGVPPPGFQERLSHELAERGVHLEVVEGTYA